MRTTPYRKIVRWHHIKAITLTLLISMVIGFAVGTFIGIGMVHLTRNSKIYGQEK